MALVEILHADGTLRLGASRNLVVYVWHDAPTLPQLRECGRVSRAVARAHPEGTALLDLIVGGIPRFSEDVRAEAARVSNDPSVSSLGAADVVLVTGLAGAAVRGFLGTLTLLSRMPRPRKVFGDVASAAAWLAPRLRVGGQAWTVPDVVAVAAEMRALPGARSAG